MADALPEEKLEIIVEAAAREFNNEVKDLLKQCTFENDTTSYVFQPKDGNTLPFKEGQVWFVQAVGGTKSIEVEVMDVQGSDSKQWIHKFIPQMIATHKLEGSDFAFTLTLKKLAPEKNIDAVFMQILKFLIASDRDISAPQRSSLEPTDDFTAWLANQLKERIPRLQGYGDETVVRIAVSALSGAAVFTGLYAGGVIDQTKLLGMIEQAAVLMLAGYAANQYFTNDKNGDLVDALKRVVKKESKGGVVERFREAAAQRIARTSSFVDLAL